ncbi:MAG: hypothetical protein KKF98_01695 [Bacteroidetes bacterium]|nr:hypothetical protein [Bacteroidota bacterium]
MKLFFRLLSRFLITFLVIVLGVVIMFYLLAPVYQFSGPVPFSGNKLYNPYQHMNSDNWLKYNFQVQSKAWMGLTSGRDNTNTLIDSIYHQLGFDHVATSDYQKINTFKSDDWAYIPTYEHGYNIFKTHQVCIDSKKVLWTDLLFWQTLSMKQWILDLLDKDTRFVVLAHPLLRGGYTLNDMKYLTNYEGIEVLNNMRVSINHWDEALSSGQRAWIIANDDAHDVTNSNEVGRRFTLINSPSDEREKVMEALEQGNAIGVDFFRINDEPMQDKYLRSRSLPVLTNASLNSDTFFVSVNTTAAYIRFIGQNGRLLYQLSDTTQASFVVPDTEPYMRTEIEFFDKSVFYLNPIIRYSGDKISTKKTASVDPSKTLYLRIGYFITALLIAYFLRRFLSKRVTK